MQNAHDYKMSLSVVCSGALCHFLVSFSIVSNAKRILVVDAVKSDGGTLPVIHGVRFLSMSWVILGHTWVFAPSYTRMYL